MTSSSPAPSTANGCENAIHGDDELRRNNEPQVGREENEEEDEDEDEEEGDVDFNPFLKETLSGEASSSLSSEVEVLDANVVDSGEKDRSTNVAGSRQDLAGGDVEHGEEIVMQATGACEAPLRNKKRKSAANYESGCTTIREKENGSGIATGAVEDVSHSKQLILDIDDEDAICKRTRARYSLASFSLDELENFLQETDDEEDLQNIDDEEEYRKFLAAVLLGGDGSSEAVEENENVDEEDEDSDDDFELELEEALESDIDENLKGGTRERDDEAVGRRPETRQKKLQKSTHRHKKKLSGQQNRPLRPILPYTPIPPSQALNGRNLMVESVSNSLSSYAKSGPVNVFTPGQIGQLHCLIYEHVQLLIQVFSLCVFEPSRYHIANQVHGLLSEILQKREQVLSSKKIPYPTFFFSPLLIHPSRPNELPEFLPAQSTVESSASAAQGVCSSGNNMMLPPDANSPSKDRYQGVSSQRHGHLQTTGGFSWVPNIGGPVLSVLDVAPLNFLGSYIDDVSIAVREYQRRHLAITFDASFEKECLFPFQFNTLAESNDDLSRRTISQTSPPVSSSSSDRAPKKRTATALIDNVRKQSIAQVPKQIAKLAERFYPLFNPFLFPHKPPPSSVANRILFTDAEDWLLARGLLKYNTDWKAIQENFLPCKTKHQIFVRQKNRSCSRAPENPIKAVRRMKTSPLTAEEKARIQEGLKVFKLDWMSIWNCIVPHRDPSLLPRQWRVAIGTQTSYKADEAKKMKRRLKKSKPASLLKEKITDQPLDKQQKVSFSAVEALPCNPVPSEVTRRQTSSGDKQRNYGHTDGHSAEEDDYIPCNHLASEVSRGQTSLEDEQRHYGERDGSSANEAVGLIPFQPVPSEAPRSQSSSDKEEGGTDNAGGGNNSGDDCVDNEDEPYVHEAFLADWRPGSSLSSGFPSTNLGGTAPIQAISCEGSHASSKRSQRPLISHQSAQPAAVLNKRSLEPNILLRPYRARRTDKLRLVKLAPDLPPVNLPPSVRVMPQSAFSRYQDEISGKISGAGSSGPVKVNAVLTSPCPAKSGMSHPTISEQEKRTPVRYGTRNLDSQVSTFVRDNSQSKEKGDSDLDMHPLLFKTSENGSLPYYPLTCNTGIPSSFNFFPKSQHQVNLSPFHSPQQPNHSAKFSDSSLKLKGLNSPLLGIDFHPLLQRTEDVDSNSVPAHSVGELSSDAAGTHMAHQNPDDVVQTNFPDNSSSWTPRAISSSPVPGTNELDLDIHLSFTAREESSRQIWRMNKGNMAISTVGAGESEIKETQTFNTSHVHPDSTLLSTLEGVANSGVSPLVTAGCDVNRINLSNTGDSSLPEIVMEHEELSDSDEEEIGENVEFECEEMTDSEGEGASDSDQIGNIHHEDVPDGSPMKLVTEKNDNDQDEPRVCDMSRSEKFGMVGTEKNDLNSILCLSLNSNPIPFASPTRAAIRNRAKLPVYRNWRGSQIDSSSKSSTLQQPDLVNISPTSSKNPSKRVPKRDSGAFKSQVRKRKSSTSTDPATEEVAPDTVKSIL